MKRNTQYGHLLSGFIYFFAKQLTAETLMKNVVKVRKRNNNNINNNLAW